MQELNLGLEPSEGYFEFEASMDDEADLDSEAFSELFESSDDAEALWEQERGGRRPAGRGRGRRIRSPRPRQGSRPRPPKLGRPTRPRGRLRRHQRSVGRLAVPCVCPAHGTELVRWIQSTLNDLRALQLPVSGLMDRVTRSALRAFQTERGLPGDGIAGPETRDALIQARAERSGRAVEGLEPAPPAAEPAGAGVAPEATGELESFWDAMEVGTRPTLRRGARGSAVVDLQSRLKNFWASIPAQSTASSARAPTRPSGRFSARAELRPTASSDRRPGPNFSAPSRRHRAAASPPLPGCCLRTCERLARLSPCATTRRRPGRAIPATVPGPSPQARRTCVSTSSPLFPGSHRSAAMLAAPTRLTHPRPPSMVTAAPWIS